jgi:maltose alpha-D-glucosyltransferase / alpha-amylase
MALNPMTGDPIPSRLQKDLPGVLPRYLQAQRWFGGKADAIRSVSIPEIIPVYAEGLSAYLLLLLVEYEAAPAQTYALPVVPVSVGQGDSPGEGAGLSFTLDEGGPKALHDALRDRKFAEWLIEMIHQNQRIHGITGEIIGSPGRALSEPWSGREESLEPSVMGGEQSNTSVRYGHRFILKFYRRIEDGVNLDQEIGRFLTEKARFRHTPPLVGTIQYQQPDRPSATLAILQGYVRNQGDAWEYTLQALDQFVHDVTARPEAPSDEVISLRSLLQQTPDPLAWESLRTYLSRVQLLGRRTGELHLALTSEPNDPDFAPEPFSADYWRSVTETTADLAHQALRLLRERVQILPPASRQKAERILAEQERLFSRLREVSQLKSMGLRTRIHGDYHLGQVLVTDDDLAIIDFEGEPERPLAERRQKVSALRDVAGMLRSFQYAASSVRIQHRLESDPSAEAQRRIVRWLRQWIKWVSTAFLQEYLRQTAGSGFLPKDKSDLSNLLEFFLLEKAVYELGYELKNRPGWVEIPLDGLLDLL